MRSPLPPGSAPYITHVTCRDCRTVKIVAEFDGPPSRLPGVCKACRKA